MNNPYLHGVMLHNQEVARREASAALSAANEATRRAESAASHAELMEAYAEARADRAEAKLEDAKRVIAELNATIASLEKRVAKDAETIENQSVEIHDLRNTLAASLEAFAEIKQKYITDQELIMETSRLRMESQDKATSILAMLEKAQTHTILDMLGVERNAIPIKPRRRPKISRESL